MVYGPGKASARCDLYVGYACHIVDDFCRVAVRFLRGRKCRYSCVRCLTGIDCWSNSGGHRECERLQAWCKMDSCSPPAWSRAVLSRSCRIIRVQFYAVRQSNSSTATGAGRDAATYLAIRTDADQLDVAKVYRVALGRWGVGSSTRPGFEEFFGIERGKEDSNKALATLTAGILEWWGGRGDIRLPSVTLYTPVTYDDYRECHAIPVSQAHRCPCMRPVIWPGVTYLLSFPISLRKTVLVRLTSLILRGASAEKPPLISKVRSYMLHNETTKFSHVRVTESSSNPIINCRPFLERVQKTLRMQWNLNGSCHDHDQFWGSFLSVKIMASWGGLFRAGYYFDKLAACTVNKRASGKENLGKTPIISMPFASVR